MLETEFSYFYGKSEWNHLHVAFIFADISSDILTEITFSKMNWANGEHRIKYPSNWTQTPWTIDTWRNSKPTFLFLNCLKCLRTEKSSTQKCTCKRDNSINRMETSPFTHLLHNRLYWRTWNQNKAMNIVKNRRFTRQ